MPDDLKYDVALSFAGEDREYVEKVASALRAHGVRVFYDRFEQAAIWGKDLYTHFRQIYQSDARFVVLFGSKHYANKAWPSHERASAQARAMRETREYILPARFDDTEIPGMLHTTGYVDLRGMPAEELARLIVQKLEQADRSQTISPAHGSDSLGQLPSEAAQRPTGPYRHRYDGDRIDRIMVPFSPPKGTNLPSGYQNTLNYHAAEIARDTGVRQPDGGYEYPVQLQGAEEKLRAFTREAVERFGATTILSEVSNGRGEIWFQYVGAAPPSSLQGLALKHELKVIQCGATLIS